MSTKLRDDRSELVLGIGLIVFGTLALVFLVVFSIVIILPQGIETFVTMVVIPAAFLLVFVIVCLIWTRAMSKRSEPRARQTILAQTPDAVIATIPYVYWSKDTIDTIHESTSLAVRKHISTTIAVAREGMSLWAGSRPIRIASVAWSEIGDITVQVPDASRPDRPALVITRASGPPLVLEVVVTEGKKKVLANRNQLEALASDMNAKRND